MELKDRLDAAKDQLNRLLAFFPRADAKASVVLGIDIGMIAILAGNAPSIKNLQWPMLFAVVPAFLIAWSLLHLYFNAFPQLDGGHDSLIYFREIAKKTESKYIEEFVAVSEEQYLKDLLGQVWRNSEILKKKFDHLKSAFVLLAAAVIPWAITLAIFAAQNSQAQNLIAK